MKLIAFLILLGVVFGIFYCGTKAQKQAKKKREMEGKEREDKLEEALDEKSDGDYEDED